MFLLTRHVLRKISKKIVSSKSKCRSYVVYGTNKMISLVEEDLTFIFVFQFNYIPFE